MGRKQIKSFFLIVGGWIATIELFILIRYFGLESIPQFKDTDLGGIDHSYLLAMGIGLGIIVGTAYFLLDRALDRPAIRRRPYGALIVFQTLGNVGFVILALVVVTLLEVLRGESNGVFSSIYSRLFTMNFLIVLLYVTVVSFLFSFLKTVDRKFGPGNLWKLIIGTYYHPKEEELIFMFLDLKGSTTHAERLGHVRFSELIQDCFIDLSVVIDHQALVYQYVGDVLNTAARIQGKCNDFGEELLVSGILRERIQTIPEDLSFREIGKVELRGREAGVAIFSVRRSG